MNATILVLATVILLVLVDDSSGRTTDTRRSLEEDRDLLGAGIGLAMGLFECFISGRWQWKLFPCDPVPEGAERIPPVTCNFTVDNEVLEVLYNDKPLNVTGGNPKYWHQEKTVTFEPEGDGYGELKVKGLDLNSGGPGEEHCTWGGLVMVCKSSDGQGPWHNFKSDLTHWRSIDYLLCTSEGGITNSTWHLAQAENNFLERLVNDGATKIWVDAAETTLIGSPMP